MSEIRGALRLDVSDSSLPPEQIKERIAEAASLLRAGQLVAFPTETVYGLGADATNADAVAGIFTAKERPHSDPLIVHIAEVEALSQVARDIPPVAWELAHRFWPGPLTLVLPRAAHIPTVVTAGGETVGVRLPAHPIARALIRAAGVPLAAPSANRFMRTSPTTAAHVLADLDGRIAAVLDGGPCVVGVESSVLDLTSEPPRLLRPGGVTLEQLREIIPNAQGPDEHASTAAGVARAPGQMARHYAPRTRLIVYDATADAGRVAVLVGARRAVADGSRVGALVPDDEAAALEALGAVVERLGPASDPAEQTRRLYAALRALDARGCDLLLAHTFASEGLGLALRDRLRRAAGGSLTAPPEASQ
ncbi:MAG TPA: L-threonylcarbamoyladenylate synthase [Ktedonobacterales bacterium]|jgi:L-threonylcarbamoyladenylate synthase|nr:L-threonylcarbamoyladenylate synthase [Ktedonobacterales bacterium]